MSRKRFLTDPYLRQKYAAMGYNVDDQNDLLSLEVSGYDLGEQPREGPLGWGQAAAKSFGRGIGNTVLGIADLMDFNPGDMEMIAPSAVELANPVSSGLGTLSSFLIPAAGGTRLVGAGARALGAWNAARTVGAIGTATQASRIPGWLARAGHTAGGVGLASGIQPGTLGERLHAAGQGALWGGLAGAIGAPAGSSWPMTIGRGALAGAAGPSPMGGESGLPWPFEGMLLGMGMDAVMKGVPEIVNRGGGQPQNIPNAAQSQVASAVSRLRRQMRVTTPSGPPPAGLQPGQIAKWHPPTMGGQMPPPAGSAAQRPGSLKAPKPVPPGEAQVIPQVREALSDVLDHRDRPDNPNPPTQGSAQEPIDAVAGTVKLTQPGVPEPVTEVTPATPFTVRRSKYTGSPIGRVSPDERYVNRIQVPDKKIDTYSPAAWARELWTRNKDFIRQQLADVVDQVTDEIDVTRGNIKALFKKRMVEELKKAGIIKTAGAQPGQAHPRWAYFKAFVTDFIRQIEKEWGYEMKSKEAELAIATELGFRSEIEAMHAAEEAAKVGKAAAPGVAAGRPTVDIPGGTADDPIYFNSKTPGFEWLSNFHDANNPAPITDMNGKVWPSAEHAYQGMKIQDPMVQEQIRNAPTSADAKRLGAPHGREASWGTKKREMMKKILRAKFNQNPGLKQKLLDTGSRQLIHEAPWNGESAHYWGTGKSGRGANELGKIIMELRDEFRSGKQPGEAKPAAKPTREMPMNYAMSAAKNIDGRNTTTFEEIWAGNRSSTTRGGSQYKVGETAVIKDPRGSGREIVVEITEVSAPITKQQAQDPAFREAWSQVERWTPDVLDTLIGKTQYKYKVISKNDPRREVPVDASVKRDVLRNPNITRETVRGAPDSIFLFGDNLERKGLGGQAKAMRGEPNAIGIATKKKPGKTADSYFTDAEYEANVKAIDEDFAKIPPDKTVVIPKDGLGTGLAELQKRAPRTFEYLQKKIAELENPPVRQEAPPTQPTEPPVQPRPRINVIVGKTTSYIERTHANSAAADVTLDFAATETGSGRGQTKQGAQKAGKPYILSTLTKHESFVDITDQLVDIGSKQSGDWTLNVAGHGLSELVKKLPFFQGNSKLIQQRTDELVYNLIKRVNARLPEGKRIRKIVSGGQTGFDEAGIKAGIRLGLEVEMAVTKDWKFRGADGIDIMDANAFMARFDGIKPDPGVAPKPPTATGAKPPTTGVKPQPAAPTGAPARPSGIVKPSVDIPEVPVVPPGEPPVRGTIKKIMSWDKRELQFVDLDPNDPYILNTEYVATQGEGAAIVSPDGTVNVDLALILQGHDALKQDRAFGNQVRSKTTVRDGKAQRVVYKADRYKEILRALGVRTYLPWSWLFTPDMLKVYLIKRARIHAKNPHLFDPANPKDDGHLLELATAKSLRLDERKVQEWAPEVDTKEVISREQWQRKGLPVPVSWIGSTKDWAPFEKDLPANITDPVQRVETVKQRIKVAMKAAETPKGWGRLKSILEKYTLRTRYELQGKDFLDEGDTYLFDTFGGKWHPDAWTGDDEGGQVVVIDKAPGEFNELVLDRVRDLIAKGEKGDPWNLIQEAKRQLAAEDALKRSQAVVEEGRDDLVDLKGKKSARADQGKAKTDKRVSGFESADKSKTEDAMAGLKSEQPGSADLASVPLTEEQIAHNEALRVRSEFFLARDAELQDVIAGKKDFSELKYRGMLKGINTLRGPRRSYFPGEPKATQDKILLEPAREPILLDPADATQTYNEFVSLSDEHSRLASRIETEYRGVLTQADIDILLEALKGVSPDVAAAIIPRRLPDIFMRLGVPGAAEAVPGTAKDPRPKLILGIANDMRRQLQMMNGKTFPMEDVIPIVVSTHEMSHTLWHTLSPEDRVTAQIVFESTEIGKGFENAQEMLAALHTEYLLKQHPTISKQAQLLVPVYKEINGTLADALIAYLGKVSEIPPELIPLFERMSNATFRSVVERGLDLFDPNNQPKRTRPDTSKRKTPAESQDIYPPGEEPLRKPWSYERVVEHGNKYGAESVRALAKNLDLFMPDLLGISIDVRDVLGWSDVIGPDGIAIPGGWWKVDRIRETFWDKFITTKWEENGVEKGPAAELEALAKRGGRPDTAWVRGLLADHSDVARSILEESLRGVITDNAIKAEKFAQSQRVSADAEEMRGDVDEVEVETATFERIAGIVEAEIQRLMMPGTNRPHGDVHPVDPDGPQGPLPNRAASDLQNRSGDVLPDNPVSVETVDTIEKDIGKLVAQSIASQTTQTRVAGAVNTLGGGAAPSQGTPGSQAPPPPGGTSLPTTPQGAGATPPPPSGQATGGRTWRGQPIIQRVVQPPINQTNVPFRVFMDVVLEAFNHPETGFIDDMHLASQYLRQFLTERGLIEYFPTSWALGQAEMGRGKASSKGFQITAIETALHGVHYPGGSRLSERFIIDIPVDGPYQGKVYVEDRLSGESAVAENAYEAALWIDYQNLDTGMQLSPPGTPNAGSGPGPGQVRYSVALADALDSGGQVPPNPRFDNPLYSLPTVFRGGGERPYDPRYDDPRTRARIPTGDRFREPGGPLGRHGKKAEFAGKTVSIIARNIIPMNTMRYIDKLWERTFPNVEPLGMAQRFERSIQDYRTHRDAVNGSLGAVAELAKKSNIKMDRKTTILLDRIQRRRDAVASSVLQTAYAKFGNESAKWTLQQWDSVLSTIDQLQARMDARIGAVRPNELAFLQRVDGWHAELAAKWGLPTEFQFAWYSRLTRYYRGGLEAGVYSNPMSSHMASFFGAEMGLTKPSGSGAVAPVEQARQTMMSRLGLAAEQGDFAEVLTTYVNAGWRSKIMPSSVADLEMVLMNYGRDAYSQGKEPLLGESIGDFIKHEMTRLMGRPTDAQLHAMSSAAKNNETLALAFLKMAQRLNPNALLTLQQPGLRGGLVQGLMKLAQHYGVKTNSSQVSSMVDGYISLHRSSIFGLHLMKIVREMTTNDFFMIMPRFENKYAAQAYYETRLNMKAGRGHYKRYAADRLLPEEAFPELMSDSTPGGRIWDWLVEKPQWLYRKTDVLGRLLITRAYELALPDAMAAWQQKRLTNPEAAYRDFMRITALDTHYGMNTKARRAQFEAALNRGNMSELMQLGAPIHQSGSTFTYVRPNTPLFYDSNFGRFLGFYGTWPINAVSALHGMMIEPLANAKNDPGARKRALKIAAKYAVAAETVYSMGGLFNVDTTDWIPFAHNIWFMGSPGLAAVQKTQQALGGDPTTTARLGRDASEFLVRTGRSLVPIPNYDITRRALQQWVPGFTPTRQWARAMGIIPRQRALWDRMLVSAGFNPFSNPISNYQSGVVVRGVTYPWRRFQDTMHDWNGWVPPGSREKTRRYQSPFLN